MPTHFSRFTLRACSHREISACPSSSDSSLYVPARTVHHSPPPASPTILQFLTSSLLASAVFPPAAGARACVCLEFCCLIDMLLVSGCWFPSALISSFAPSLFDRYTGSAAIFRIYGTWRKFVFTSSHYRDAVIAATHPENAPEDSLILFAFPAVEIKIMWVSLKTTSPGASICFFSFKSSPLNIFFEDFWR